MTKRPRVLIELSTAQAWAAFLACSNYTPERSKPWAQRSQTLAAQALRAGMVRAGMFQRKKK